MTARKIIAFILRRLNLRLLDLIANIKNKAFYQVLINIFSFLFMYKVKIISSDKDLIKLKEKKDDISISICYKNRFNYI